MSSETTVPRTAGRKRDPHIERRAIDAALAVYAADGWQGFTFDAIARLSGVGKPALYRRWASREHLLIDAFDKVEFPAAADHGSFRADVSDYVGQWVAWYRQPVLPQAGSRILLDAASNETLSRLYNERVIERRGTAARQVTRRAIARGEIPEGTPATVIPEIIIGAFFAHWAYTQDASAPAYLDDLAGYGERLVETLMAGFSIRK
jgi:AcrR family transcriptional regulator